MIVEREPVVVTLNSPSLLSNNLSAREQKETSEKTYFATVHGFTAGVFATKLSSDYAGNQAATRSQMGNLLDFREFISRSGGTQPIMSHLTQVWFRGGFLIEMIPGVVVKLILLFLKKLLPGAGNVLRFKSRISCNLYITA